ncbi:protein kinase domain-containing protein [Nocardia crassostreae]|uniref:protein kinase domain-containing protein n=1 Tax=Nocardia crassostreae TaxID=53428 RepID=UPI000829812C|nr:protein kinase [Nocardia crassostreae]
MSGNPVHAVARFAADWESTLRGDRLDPPLLDRYVPDGVDARLAVLTDLVRVDMRQRWRRAGMEKRITEYRTEFPEVAASPDFVDLVCEEYLVRSRYRAIDVDTFAVEYPEVAGEIRARFAESGGARPAPPPSLPEGIGIGRRLDDFDLLTDLGGSAHRRMFLARQRSMQRLVAVRVEAGADSDTPTVAQLDHQYIVRVFDQRLIADGTTGKPLRLLYMQYLPGGTVADVLAQRRAQPGPASVAALGGDLLLRAVDAAIAARGEIRPADSRIRAEIAELSWPETVAWVGRRLAEALDHAERHGVLHHDIRPGNVVFTAEGVPKLADFALGPLYWAGAPPPAAAADTAALRYRSPEALAVLLDPTAPLPGARGDIYSLGVLLWEMLTGAVPFEDAAPGGGAVADLLTRRRAGVPAAALAALPPETPAALRRVLLECLHPDPERRWQHGAELAGQLELCLDPRARDLVDPPRTSLRARMRGWPVPIAVLCVGLPNALASVYNIRLNQSLIVNRLAVADQERFETVALVNNAIAFPLAALLLLWLARRPLTVSYRLAHGRHYTPAELARARADTLLMGERAVWIPFAMWLLAGMAWPVALSRSGAALPPNAFAYFFTAQVVCAAIALAYPFFLVSVYAVRSLYPQLLARGAVGPDDRRQLLALARRSNFYLAASASVPLLGVATATFVAPDDLELVIGTVRWLSVGGLIAFVLTYRLFRLLEDDLRALARAIPQSTPI